MGRLFAADAAAASTALNGAVDWWKDVNESPMWQDRMFHALAVLYGVVSVVALVSPAPPPQILFLIRHALARSHDCLSPVCPFRPNHAGYL
jgi:hypothetical protein